MKPEKYLLNHGYDIREGMFCELWTYRKDLMPVKDMWKEIQKILINKSQKKEPKK